MTYNFVTPALGKALQCIAGDERHKRLFGVKYKLAGPMLALGF